MESKFILVNQNVLIEVIYDDTFYADYDYTIIKDSKNNTSSFAINGNQFNNINNQLFVIDNTLNKYGVVDFDKYNFLTENRFVNNSNSQYTKIKIWFPINYNFNDVKGFYCSIYGLDFNNTSKYYLSNFYLDKSSNLFNQITLEQTPFRSNDKLWGKSITLHVPSISYEANNRANNKAKVGTINYNLTGNTGLSTTAPIYFDFRFLYNKQIILNETIYLTTGQVIFSSPQNLINNNLSVEIKPASDGDYFVINGKHNNSIGELDNYMNIQAMSGNTSYILYSITVYENNLPQSTRDIYVYENFAIGIDDYRPVLKYTNTLASIRVDMKIISSVNNSMTIKTTEYVLTGNEVARYGKHLSAINVSNAIKPKLYNSAPTQITLPAQDIINSYFKRKVNKKLELRYVPYPVLFNSADIAIKNLHGDNSVLENNNLNITLKPFDNVFKFQLLDYTQMNQTPYSIPVQNTIVNMIFKSDALTVRLPLFLESNEVDLNNGILVFKIAEADLTNIKKIYSVSNIWYITISTNNIETVIYSGKYLFEKKVEVVKPTKTLNNDWNLVSKDFSSTRKPNITQKLPFKPIEGLVIKSENIKNIPTIKTRFNL